MHIVEHLDGEQQGIVRLGAESVLDCQGLRRQFTGGSRVRGFRDQSGQSWEGKRGVRNERG